MKVQIPVNQVRDVGEELRSLPQHHHVLETGISLLLRVLVADVGLGVGRERAKLSLPTPTNITATSSTYIERRMLVGGGGASLRSSPRPTSLSM